MTTLAVATPSIGVLDAWRDVTVSVTFKTSDPTALTEVVVDPDPVDNGCFLQALDAAITRLIVYRAAFIDAEAEDAAPTPLPMPWYAWGR